MKRKIIKRTFDFILSSILIILLIIPFVCISLIIIISTKESPIYLSKRIGQNKKIFIMPKFRTMRKETPQLATHLLKNSNEYLSNIGSLLRKTSIDELPQFFNVLAGNMSVVGPRPHMIKENEKYLKSIDKFMVRHFIKPGITGLAQVNGYRGEIETNLDIVNRIKFDINYIENWSLLLDLKIITLTVFNLFRGEKKAY